MPRILDLNALSEATVGVYAERGYAAATTQEIAARAGVNEVTLYRRYGSKAGLLTAALAHCLRHSPFAALTPSNDARADLLAIVRAYLETHQAYGGAVMTLLTDAARHPELRPALSVLFPNLKRAAQLVARHQRRGRISRGDPLQKVMFLLAPIIAAGLWARTGVKLRAARVDPVEVVDAFLDGHGRRGGASRPRRSPLPSRPDR